MSSTVLSTTQSVCPVCLERIPASRVAYGREVYLEKDCPRHGHFKTKIWGGQLPYEGWANEKIPSAPINGAGVVQRGCPFDCGLCPEHRQHTCCVLLEVTQRCSLGCPICYASAGSPQGQDPSLEDIGQRFDEMMRCGGPFNIQLSGGEPTEREDLPEIIRMGRERGFTFFQLNTNGLRIASDKEYLDCLREAGLDCVFLQFDGLRDSTYQALRGRPLFEQKQRAIEACREAGLGVVLVPVLVPGVNIDEIGDILRFAFSQMPTVRGVHFQPVSYFGRYGIRPPEERFTLSDLLWEIERQSGGKLSMEQFSPGGAENAYCSFSGNFIEMEDGSLRPWSAPQSCCCGKPPVAGQAARKAQKFVARQWSGRRGQSSPKLSNGKPSATASLDAFLDRIENHSLAISSMAFMDAWNLDLERLRDCYIHVVCRRDGKVNLIPFCAYNLSSAMGGTLYRGVQP